MKESFNRFLQEDYDNIASTYDASFLEGKKILITGATGLVGSNLVKALLCINRIHNLNITLFAGVRNIAKAEQIYAETLHRGELKIVLCDVENEISLSQNIDYVVHTVSVTSSKQMIDKPVETITTSFIGTKNILEFARKCGCKKIIYISSMEMYGDVHQIMDGKGYIEEKDIGYLDPLVLRNNYPESKRMCENLCLAYYKEYGLNVSIARLAQTFGAGILKEDTRVYAQFAKSAINKQNIILHTKGDSEGNYCYLRDALKGILILMEKGTPGEAYNICNENCHTTIAGMAEMICHNIMKDEIRVEYDIPENNIYGYANKTKMKLSSKKLKALGWWSDISLEEAYRRTIDYLNSLGEKDADKE